ncbi:MAG: endonuclease/exonuclease/phosphatase family protein [Phycisphaerales bacterium]|nr:endonuclease/exonuclease/phosphatase family protein [Planctomycetota bacterium]MBL6997543.1 endonuclease/exonuclease/phosphatase family protein [Phycisphaerales bacterium]
MLILPILCLALSPIQIDGSFHDWEDGVTHQEDDYFVYQLIELPSEACLQQLPEQKVVEIGEYTVFFSPKGKGYGVSCKKGDEWISPYDAGVVFAPTTAATSFELRVNKPKTTFPTKQCEALFTPKGDLRVVSWNVQFGNLLDDTERSARILKALQPDVLLLQELDGDDTPATITDFINAALGGNWTAATSTSSGTERHHKLKSAIVTSLQSKIFECIAKQKIIVGAIYVKEKPINFISLHLRCCGGPTGEAEEQRQEEAKSIRSIIDNMQSPRFVIAGDWNLVGTTKPLEIVQANRLAIVDAFQPDMRLNATWSDTASSFTPGRLDWMLYSPETLTLVNSFVLDTADIDKKTSFEKNLKAEDTAKLSDHLPLVADFRIVK